MNICIYNLLYLIFLLRSPGSQPPTGVATVADTKSIATTSEIAHLAFLGQRE